MIGHISANQIRHNKHTHTNQKAATDQHCRQNHEVHCKLHQGTQSIHNIQKPHIHTVNLKLAFLKVATSHLHYLIFTLQNYHHPEHPVQIMTYADAITITSTHTNTSAAKNTYNHTYIRFLPGQIITISH